MNTKNIRSRVLGFSWIQSSLSLVGVKVKSTTATGVSYIRAIRVSIRAGQPASGRARRVVATFAVVATGVIITFSLGASVLALGATQGYKTTQTDITTGMAVAIVNSKASGSTDDYVGKASQAQAEKTIGVVVNPNDSTISVTSTGAQVYVATTGVATVYVSDIGGEPVIGDLLVPSPIEGVLMRADTGTIGVLGVALEKFPAKEAQTVSVQQANGKSQKVKVGLMRLNMDIKVAGNSNKSNKNFLQRIGKSVTGHSVSNAQAVIAVIIIIVMVVVVGGISYAGVSSALISLGRNPFARKSILRGLAQTGMVVVGILIVGFTAVYVVLLV
jgi:hypothetical protein